MSSKFPNLRQGIAVAILTGLLLTGCKDRGEKDPFDAAAPGALVSWINRHNSDVTDVKFEDGTLTMSMHKSGMGAYVFSAASEVFDILKAFKVAASNHDALRAIEIVHMEELVDQYKNSVGKRPVAILRFDAIEALKYNFERATGFDMVDTARILSLHPIAARAPAEYCARNGDFSRKFCARYGK